MSLVLDASLAVGCLFEDEVTDDRLAVLRQVSVEGAVVPSLWHLEVANALQVNVRRGRCDQVFVDQALGRLARLPIIIDAETAMRAWSTTLELARAEALSIYDASYLELALRRDIPLATCDTALAEAARRRAVTVIG